MSLGGHGVSGAFGMIKRVTMAVVVAVGLVWGQFSDSLIHLRVYPPCTSPPPPEMKNVSSWMQRLKKT